MSDLNRLNPGRHSLHSRDNLSRGESRLHDLIMQAESWRHTAQALEARLPAKLQQHCRAVRAKEKQAKLSRTAAEQCLAAADDLAHHPELAAALRHLARHAEEEGGE